MCCFEVMDVVRRSLPRLLWVVLVVSFFHHPAYARDRSLLIIVDMEPDDRVALLLLAAEYPAEIVLVGTTGMHAGRKRVLADQFLNQTGLPWIPVIQGTGGEPSSYPDIASTRAARQYQSEGHGLLSETDLTRINRDMPRSSEKLNNAIRSLLKERDDIEIVLLAPATDLVRVLESDPSLKPRIIHIHLMAGWSERILPSGKIDRHTTYNWNMDPVAGATLMSMKSVPMTLYSSHIIKSSFSGGSVNADNFPAIIGELESQQRRVPAFRSFWIAANSWDHHLMDQMPALRKVIGANAGRQFTPADPVVVVGMARPDFVTSTRLVDINIDLHSYDASKGYKVTVNDDPGSRIKLVEVLDTGIFRRQVLGNLQQITATAPRPSED